MTYYLAIDIGASSGRHILGYVEDGRLCLEEIYRFDNTIRTVDGSLTWDLSELLNEVKAGIARAGELGKIPKSVAIDTWGVDYVLLDENKRELLPAYCYRDKRCEAAARAVGEILPQDELYAITGIQKQSFNTVYQLYADKLSGKLDLAKHFLMIPEYLSFKLTGEIKNEYTNATTTNLVNAKTKTWDEQIISRLGLPRELFGELSLPGESVGHFSDEVINEVGFDTEVVLCPSHDTASAVAACPVREGDVYISSGTWSLIGTENTDPVLSREAMEENFTNEGGIEYRFRFLKNIMGMWLFQSVKRELRGELSYDGMMELAKASSFKERIDPNSPDFVAPNSMIAAVRHALGMPDLPLGDLLSSLYHSLAYSYKDAISAIERISNKKIREICIVGGGSRDSYLSELTCAYTGKRVTVGLTEATATGNLISQIMRHRSLTLTEARELVKNTFSSKEVNR